MTALRIFSLLALAAFTFASCGDDDSSTATNTLTLNLSGLEPLGDDAIYEGWLIVDGAAVTTGTFRVDENGNPSETAFDVDADDLAAATTFVLTIEPFPDSDPAPSKVHILAGDFSGSGASLSVGHGAALGSDFTSATGRYILATPTNGDNNDELSGVWWLDPAAGPAAGLTLPTLPEGWAYEGWAVIGGTPVSTGTFTDPAAADSDGRFSGSQGAPPFPGEDFLMNAPGGLSFPTSLAGATVVISIEPVPDNSPAPFTLKPLVANVSPTAIDHTVYNMNNNAAATNPVGTAAR